MAIKAMAAESIGRRDFIKRTGWAVAGLTAASSFLTTIRRGTAAGTKPVELTFSSAKFFGKETIAEVVEAFNSSQEKIHVTYKELPYAELCGLSVGSWDTIGKACELAETLNLSRLCVHSDTWALTVTKGDPQCELEALLCGWLLASVRAEKGFPCRPVEVPAEAEFHPLRWEEFSQGETAQ